MSRCTAVRRYRFAVRNRYLDLLRAAAIIRVIVYHLFGWPWLSVVLPAMGVMFALAGSLTAASLDKRGAGSVITARLRRLLPPLWLLGLIAVPVMLALGWAHENGGQQPFSPTRLWLWILPVGDPPGSDKGIDVWEPLWYIRAYLWFVVLSPAMYLAYKKAGWVAVAAPVGLVAVLDKTGFGLPATADAAMWDFVTYAACWMTGFAHHDGRLAKTRPWLVATAALLLGAAAMYWLSGHPGEGGYDLNDVTESQALWSLAFVLVVLRWQPPMGWLARARPLDRAVTLLNGRAVTIYLWHNIAIAAVWPVLTVLALDDLGGLDGVVDLTTALVLTAGAVLAFGWAEDLAARRRPRLWPDVETPRVAKAGAEAARAAAAGAAAAGAAAAGAAAAGAETAGAETAGAEAAGAEAARAAAARAAAARAAAARAAAARAAAAGAETARAETAGGDAAGAEAARAVAAGAETAGAETAGAETAGAETAGAEAARHSAASAGRSRPPLDDLPTRRRAGASGPATGPARAPAQQAGMAVPQWNGHAVDRVASGPAVAADRPVVEFGLPPDPRGEAIWGVETRSRAGAPPALPVTAPADAAPAHVPPVGAELPGGAATRAIRLRRTPPATGAAPSAGRVGRDRRRPGDTESRAGQGVARGADSGPPQLHHRDPQQHHRDPQQHGDPRQHHRDRTGEPDEPTAMPSIREPGGPAAGRSGTAPWFGGDSNMH